jgi:LEA14-like dessication related protein
MYRKPIVRILLLLLPFFLLISCKSFIIPDYKEFRNFKMGSLGMSESDITMDLVYYNPNHIGFQVRRTEADVYVNNVYLGKAISDTLIKVARKSDFVIPLHIKTNMKNLLSNSWGLLTKDSVMVTASGTITAGVAGVFKTIPLTYEGKHAFSLFAPQP